MTLLSMKIAKSNNFLKQALTEFPVDLVQIKAAVLHSMKFVVGKELLPLDGTIDEIFHVLYGNDSKSDEFIPSKKKEKLLEQWNKFSKLPFKVIFLENNTGGMLLQETTEGIICTEIRDDGTVDPMSALIPNVLTDDQLFAKLVCNHSLLTLMQVGEKKLTSTEAGSPDTNMYLKSIQKTKLTGILILNALLHINALNVSINQYKPSKRELESISKIHRDFYSYSVVDIFTNKKRMPLNIKEVEAFSQSPMSSVIRAHMVRGHFKQRSGGIYWWNPFLRCKKNDGFVDKHYNVISN